MGKILILHDAFRNGRNVEAYQITDPIMKKTPIVKKTSRRSLDDIAKPIIEWNGITDIAHINKKFQRIEKRKERR